ncbi:MAG: alpha-hydroxy-acid oxidizing protein [Nitrososphaerales archaeon]
MPKISALTMEELEKLARKKLSRETWRHIGYAETGSSYRRNLESFQKLLLKQRVFHGFNTADTSLELFGQKISTPVLVSPISSFYRVGPRAEPNVVSGAQKAGSMVFVGSFYELSLEQLARKSHPPLALQLYPRGGLDAVIGRMKQAESLGFVAVGVTVDVVQPSKLGESVVPGRGPGYTLTMKDIERLRKETSLPFFVKGIMCEEDARLAVEAGADVIIVSNHGGRLMDYSRAPLEAIPEIVQAVGNQALVFADSGFRRGTDVLKALALGAKAVLIGRPIFWGVAVGGSDGVAQVITKITEELRRGMVFCGVESLDNISDKILIRP